jgi:Transcriptional regulator containing an amidase domain and an AraC-type DNA-binding HTH domain
LGDDVRDIGFLLTPSFSALGLAAAIEALFIANWLSGRSLYEWRTLSRTGGDVRSSSGLRIAVDGGIAGPVRYDAVFVLASFEPKENARDAKIRAWLRRLARYGTELGASRRGARSWPPPASWTGPRWPSIGTISRASARYIRNAAPWRSSSPSAADGSPAPARARSST